MTELENFIKSREYLYDSYGSRPALIFDLRFEELPVVGAKIVPPVTSYGSEFIFTIGTKRTPNLGFNHVKNFMTEYIGSSNRTFYRFAGNTAAEKKASLAKLITYVFNYVQNFIDRNFPKVSDSDFNVIEIKKKAKAPKEEPAKAPGKEEVEPPEAKASSSTLSELQDPHPSDREIPKNEIIEDIGTIAQSRDKSLMSVDKVADIVKTVNQSYIPIDSSIRDTLHTQRGIIDALKAGERICQVFYRPPRESEKGAISFDVFIIELDGETIVKNSKFEISIDKRDIGSHLSVADIADAIRGVLGNKPIMAQIQAVQRGRIAPAIDRGRALREYKKMKAR